MINKGVPVHVLDVLIIFVTNATSRFLDQRTVCIILDLTFHFSFFIGFWFCSEKLYIHTGLKDYTSLASKKHSQDQPIKRHTFET